MEARAFLAILLSFIVFVAWGAYISKKEIDYMETLPQVQSRRGDITEKDEIAEKSIRKKIEEPQKMLEETPSSPDFEIIKADEIKDIFIELSAKIKNKTNWNIEEYWQKIYEIMLLDSIKIE